MFLISFANSLPRLASMTAFLCLVVAHFEWPLTVGSVPSSISYARPSDSSERAHRGGARRSAGHGRRAASPRAAAPNSSHGVPGLRGSASSTVMNTAAAAPAPHSGAASAGRGSARPAPRSGRRSQRAEYLQHVQRRRTGDGPPRSALDRPSRPPRARRSRTRPWPVRCRPVGAAPRPQRPRAPCSDQGTGRQVRRAARTRATPATLPRHGPPPGERRRAVHRRTRGAQAARLRRTSTVFRLPAPRQATDGIPASASRSTS